MSIADVDFGRLDAEAETNLKTYFVDTGVLQKFRDGAKHYVLGRKGSGKTALFKSATPEVLRRDVIPIEFNDYPWETHKLIREGGLPSESAYVASWRFTFLAEICRHWMRAATTDELRREAGLAGWWLARRALRPVAEMTAAADRINVDRLSERVSGPSSSDELGRLAATLNTMLDRIETVVNFAQTMTWKGNPPVVRLLTTIYHTGVRLTKKAMTEVEKHLERLSGLKRWFVKISGTPFVSLDT